jgi:preprotein translocase subunit YajC
MPFHFALTSIPAVLFAKASTTTTKGSPATFYIILVLLVGVYFFYLRPRRQKLLQRQAAMKAPTEIQAGDTVITSSGIIGRVLSIDGDRATVEIAPDTVVEFDRASLGRRLEPTTPEAEQQWASLIEDDPATAAPNAHEVPSTDEDPKQATRPEDEPRGDGQ